MVKVSIQIRKGAACMKVRVMASSVERAASITGVSYPGEGIELLLPAVPNVRSGGEGVAAVPFAEAV